MDKVEQAKQSIIKGIISYVDKKINGAKFDKTMTGFIVGVNSNNTYSVNINEKLYHNVNTIGGSCKLNDTVKVKLCQSNYNNLIIEVANNSNPTWTTISSGFTSNFTAYDSSANKPMYRLNNGVLHLIGSFKNIASISDTTTSPIKMCELPYGVVGDFKVVQRGNSDYTYQLIARAETNGYMGLYLYRYGNGGGSFPTVVANSQLNITMNILLG